MHFDFNIYNLLGGTIFSGIGFCAIVYAKNEMAMKPAVLGLILLIYPFFVTNTILLYAVGIACTAFLFLNN